MKFGTHILGIGLRHIPEVAQSFEANGFESIWVGEHLVFPAAMPATYPYTGSGYPPVTSDTPSYDPWSLLSFIAAATSTIRLATNVYVLPLRHPLVTARSVVTVDRLSGGRVTLGIGVGWLEEEFHAVGQPFSTRGRRTDSCISALRRLWNDDIVEVHDEHLHFGPVKFQPKPLQEPSIPIEVGGSARAALVRAGRLGDGWIEIGSVDVDEFSSKLEVVMEARRSESRSGPFEVSVPAALAPGIDGFRRLRDAGATRIIVVPPFPESGRPTPEGWSDWAKRFADDVISSIDDR